jgi:hypothetical protein
MVWADADPNAPAASKVAATIPSVLMIPSSQPDWIAQVIRRSTVSFVVNGGGQPADRR